MWDALRVEPDEWKRLHGVLVGHCETVGRDPSEIECSAHVGYSSHRQPQEAVDEAATLFEAGADMAVFSMRPPYELSAAEALARSWPSRIEGWFLTLPRSDQTGGCQWSSWIDQSSKTG